MSFLKPLILEVLPAAAVLPTCPVLQSPPAPTSHQQGAREFWVMMLDADLTGPGLDFSAVYLTSAHMSGFCLFSTSCLTML